MRKCLLFIILFIVFSTVSARASENFYSKYIVTYRFNDQGQSTVTQEISLTNKFSQIYASQYQLSLTGETPEILTGHDSSGPLKITSHSENNNTLITVNFNDSIVGIGNSLHFTLSYLGTPAIHKGQVWEITLPKLGNSKDIDEYTLNLQTPNSFGKAAYISPTPQSQILNEYTFTKNQISQSAIVAAFGDFQTYGFKLSWEINNPQSRSAEETIAIPPDTPYQRLFYSSIEPSPKIVSVDKDGNWLATYLLKPNQKLTIVATGHARIVAKSSFFTPMPSSEYLQSLTVPTIFWPKTDLTNKTPQQIYDFVVNTLSYDYSRINSTFVRKGGLSALTSPSSSLCSEFTDAFITLARAAKIPAREINGFAYTTDTRNRPLGLENNILHAWPEFWDESQKDWVSIDPTWGKTTGGIDYFHRFDLSHFAFVIHGQSDSSPQPPSGVKVELASYKELPHSEPQITWNQPFQILPFIRTKSSLTIKNSTGQAIYNLPVYISSSNIVIASPLGSTITVLPPYSQTVLPLVFAPHNLPSFTPSSFQVSLANFPMTYNIPYKLFLGWQLTLGLTISIILITLGFVAHHSWSLHLQKQQKSDSVRRKSH